MSYRAEFAIFEVALGRTFPCSPNLMKVTTLGNRENPAIVMIPGMFCTAEMPERIGKYLQDEFFVILPTLDGHHIEEPVYHSKEDDGKEIAAWLHEEGITQLALLQGTSMGAEVALEVMRQSDIPVGHALFDGGPFFHFPQFFRAIMARKFLKFRNLVRGKDRDEAMRSILASRFVKKLGAESIDSYKTVLDGFIDVCQWIDAKSIRRIADTCYKCDLPAFDAEIVKKFTFLYSENEPARKAESCLRKKYPDAEYVIMSGYGHGGFQTEKPEEYATLMRRKASTAV